MMKRIASFISALVLCILVMPLSLPEAKAEMLTGYPKESALIDERELYINDKEEYEQLDKKIKDEAEKLGINIIVFTAGHRRDERAVEIFADDSFDEIFGENTDGVFLYIDTSGNSPANDWISTSGKCVFTYKSTIERLLDALYAYLPPSSEPVYAEDITLAVEAYLNALDKYSTTKNSDLAYDYDPDSDTYAYFKNGEYVVSDHKPAVAYIKPFLISAIIGLFTALIVYAVTKSNYKFKGTPDPKAYVVNELSNFRRKEDIYIRTDTHRTRISSNSGGSSHRSGGGGHSHGGHHGGGGRHR